MLCKSLGEHYSITFLIKKEVMNILTKIPNNKIVLQKCCENYIILIMVLIILFCLHALSH